jgi:hypothetical protein
MKTKNSISSALLTKILNEMKPSEKELKELKDIESKRDQEGFDSKLKILEKKYESMQLADIKTIDPKSINNQALRRANALPVKDSSTIHGTITGMLNEIKSDIVIPLCCQGLTVYGAMSGPNVTSVYRGILGANGYNDDEYSVFNAGKTKGKGRVPVSGYMDLLFSADLKLKGKYCLLIPQSHVYNIGSVRVIGRGNSSTCYDSKVWVTYIYSLYCNDNQIEIVKNDIHYDGTRSEDRTSEYNVQFDIPPRYLYFNAPENSRVELIHRLEVYTEANEDGKVYSNVGTFGFVANFLSDYDTFVIKV